MDSKYPFKTGDVVDIYGRPFRIKEFTVLENDIPRIELDVHTTEEVEHIRKHYYPYLRSTEIPSEHPGIETDQELYAVLFTTKGVTPSYRRGSTVYVYGRPFRIKACSILSNGEPHIEFDISTQEEVLYIRKYYGPDERSTGLQEEGDPHNFAAIFTFDGVTSHPPSNESFELQLKEDPFLQ